MACFHLKNILFVTMRENGPDWKKMLCEQCFCQIDVVSVCGEREIDNEKTYLVNSRLGKNLLRK